MLDVNYIADEDYMLYVNNEEFNFNRRNFVDTEV